MGVPAGELSEEVEEGQGARPLGEEEEEEEGYDADSASNPDDLLAKQDERTTKPSHTHTQVDLTS